VEIYPESTRTWDRLERDENEMRLFIQNRAEAELPFATSDDVPQVSHAIPPSNCNVHFNWQEPKNAGPGNVLISKKRTDFKEYKHLGEFWTPLLLARDEPDPSVPREAVTLPVRNSIVEVEKILLDSKKNYVGEIPEAVAMLETGSRNNTKLNPHAEIFIPHSTVPSNTKLIVHYFLKN
jgi:hypothetical protein